MGTPMSSWKGRLRSHQVTPQRSPKRRLPSLTKKLEEKEEVQTLKKEVAPKKTTARGRHAGAAAAQQPRAPSSQSSRLAGTDPKHPIVIDDDVSGEHKARPDQSTITPLRRSPRFHVEDKSLGKSLLPPNRRETSTNRKTKTTHRRDKNLESLTIMPLRRSPRFHVEDKSLGKSLLPPNRWETSANRKTKTSHRKDKIQESLTITPLRRSPRFHVEDKSLGKSLLPPNHQGTSANRNTKTAHRKNKNQESLKRNRRSAGFPPRKGISDVSNKKSDKQELKPNHCKVQTGKRKRGTERRVPSKKQSCQDPEPFPAYCQEIVPCNEPRKSTHRRIEKDPSIEVKLKVGDERLTNIDENINKPSGTEREGMGNVCGSDDWTEEQDMALRKAYFSARPSPHFWKKVSKMVPGRSAEDCFNRIYSDLSTPTPIGPRSRASKTTFSPIGNFTLSDPELPNFLEPTLGRRKTAKQKSLVAQKAVKHLLQKHQHIDQAQEADHFSIFESSPVQLNFSFEDSPGTPDTCMNSASLGKRSRSSSARKKPFSRLGTKPSEPSPAVLKPIKNAILHEKYINQLARREGTKRPRRTSSSSKAADSGMSLSEKQAGSVKVAKNALISEATDFIRSFKTLQANSLAHIVENSEDEFDSDASDCSP